MSSLKGGEYIERGRSEGDEMRINIRQRIEK